MPEKLVISPRILQDGAHGQLTVFFTVVSIRPLLLWQALKPIQGGRFLLHQGFSIGWSYSVVRQNTMAVVCCSARAEPLTHCGQKAELKQEEGKNKLYPMWHTYPIGISDNPPNDWSTDKDFWSNQLNNWVYQLSPNCEHKWGGLGDDDVFGGQSFCYHKMSTSLICSDHLNM